MLGILNFGVFLQAVVRLDLRSGLRRGKMIFITKRRLFFGLLTVISIMMLVQAAPALAQQGPEIPITDHTSLAEYPDVAFDSNGNIHIVYSDDVDSDSREIWYTMLDSSGSTLIGDTQITADDDEHSVRPTIGVDSNNRVHIVWQDQGGTAIAYTKLNPYLDDRDGDPADPATITVVDDTTLAYDDVNYYQQWPRLAIDSAGNVNVVWNSYYEGIFYLQTDNNGNITVAEKMLKDCSTYYTYRSAADVAVDSNDNVHITWSDYEDTDEYEIYYMMLNGSDGSTLIDYTRMTPDDYEISKASTINVDSDDNVHLVWKDGRGDGQAVYYTKLNPGLDDQDGDAADPSAITLIDDKPVSIDSANVWVQWVSSDIQCGRYIHIAWVDYYDANLYYMIINTNGNTVVPNTQMTSTGSVTYYYYTPVARIAAEYDGMAHMVWCDSRYGGYDIYYTTYQGPPCEEEKRAAKVPTVNEWGMIILTLLFAGSALWFIIRQRKRIS